MGASLLALAKFIYYKDLGGQRGKRVGREGRLEVELV